jgi:hypothetical protein
LKKPEKSQFYQGFRSDVKPFLGVPFLRFGYDIRWGFAVAHAPQSHATAVAAAAASLQPASSNQQPLKRWKKEYVCRSKLKKKSFTFTRDSEVTLSLFWGFLCYVWGTKLGGVLPLRMRHKARQRQYQRQQHVHSQLAATSSP